MKKPKKLALCLVGLALVLVGGLVAAWVQRAGFTVQVQTFALVGSSGGKLTGKLYRPKTASAEAPAATVLICPGGNQEYVLQESLAAQLAQQGYVVVLYNAYKHGSSGIFSEETMGAADMFQYVAALDFVDQTNIGAVGHTLGGAYLGQAAARMPGVLRALISLDAVSINGALRSFNSTTPLNLAWVLALYDEHQPAEETLENNLDLQRLYGNQPLVVGQPVGSFAENTARCLYQVPTVSPLLSYSEATQKAVSDFLGQALEGAQGGYRPGVIWWLQGARGLTLAGMLLFLFGLCRWLLQGRFSGLASKIPPRLVPCGGRATCMLLCPLVAAGAYLPLYMLGKRILAPSALFPQTDTNGLSIWAAFSACLYLFCAFSSAGQAKGAEIGREILWEQPRRIGQTLGLALLVMGAAYALNGGTIFVFGESIGFFTTNFSLLTARRWLALCSYFPIFLMYFVCCGVFQARFLYFRTGLGTGPALHYASFHTLGFALLLALSWLGFWVQGEAFFYTSRFAFMPIPYMLPLLPVMGVLEAWCYRRTGKIYLGAFLNTLLFCWLFVGGNAMFLTL